MWASVAGIETGEIAVFAAFRAFDDKRRHVAGRQDAVRLELGQGLED